MYSKFQIKKVRFDDTAIELSDKVSTTENVFTMLVGKNGTGKTRTLSKIVNHYIFEEGGHSQNEVENTADSLRYPDRVIVVSNSRFVKFYDSTLPVREKKRLAVDYRYLALGGFRSSIARNISLGFEGVLSKISRREDTKFLASVFDYAGFLPAIDFQLRRSYSSERVYDDSDLYNLYDRFSLSLRACNIDFVDVANAHKRWRDRFPDGSASLRLNLASNWSGREYGDDSVENLLPLVLIGILTISRVTLFSKSTKDKVPFSNASSGQQCLLLMFFGLAGYVAHNSLVCIDEPEISLHPRWQSDFIGLLQQAFSNYKGCHFLIATHSPQMVAGLTSKNGFVADLESRNLLNSTDYSRQSTDFQLSEVFHEPGYRNEYLIRVLLVILSKLKRGEMLADLDIDRLHQIERLEDRIPDNDPVKHLYEQLRTLVFQ